MNYKKANSIVVDGNGNLTLQDVTGQNITINHNDTTEINKLISSANEKILNQIQTQYAQQQVLQTSVLNTINKELLLRKRKSKIQNSIIALAVILLVIVSAIAYTNYTQNFSFSVKLTSQQNAKITEGTLSAKLLDNEFKAESNQNGEFFFKDMLANYKNEEMKFSFSHAMLKIKNPDSLYTLTPNTNYTLAVLYKDIDRIFGTITNEDNIPVANAIITIAEKNTKTATNGHFEIKIPLEKQKPELRISVFKETYALYDKEITIDAKNPTDIVLRK